MIRYAKPKSVEEALALLSGDQWRILAGGTDFYPAQGTRPIRDNVLDINGLAELRGVAETPDGLTIGARTTWMDIARAKLPPACDGLRQAAREVGSIQIQNCGTVAGNLCNASPAADGVPPLLTLDAQVELRSARGARRLPLSAFILGNRRTERRPDELVTAILLPSTALDGAAAFGKLGARRYLVISIAMASVRMVVDGAGAIREAAVAVGSCSAVALRLSALESRLLGLADQAPIEAAVVADPFAGLAPISDVRGTAAYRGSAVREVVARTILAALPARRARAA